MKKFSIVFQEHIPFMDTEGLLTLKMFKSPGVKKPIFSAMLYFQAPLDSLLPNRTPVNNN